MSTRRQDLSTSGEDSDRTDDDLALGDGAGLLQDVAFGLADSRAPGLGPAAFLVMMVMMMVVVLSVRWARSPGMVGLASAMRFASVMRFAGAMRSAGVMMACGAECGAVDRGSCGKGCARAHRECNTISTSEGRIEGGIACQATNGTSDGIRQREAGDRSQGSTDERGSNKNTLDKHVEICVLVIKLGELVTCNICPVYL